MGKFFEMSVYFSWLGLILCVCINIPTGTFILTDILDSKVLVVQGRFHGPLGYKCIHFISRLKMAGLYECSISYKNK